MRKRTLLTITLALACACAQPTPPAPAGTGKDLPALKEASLKYLPESFRDVWIGIPEEKLAAARAGAKPQLSRVDPDERKWYKEVDTTGVNVWYGVDRADGRLAVIQFAHSIPSWKVFGDHAALLMEQYGTEYELFRCPTQDPKLGMTRLLWTKKPLAIMEAVLEGKGIISVTMVLSSLADARKAIEKNGCPRVDKEKALEEWVREQLEKEQDARKKGDDGHGHGQ